MKVKHSGKYRFIVIILVLIGPIRGLNAQLFESFYDQAFFQLDSTNAGDTEKFRIAETVADSLKRLLNEYAFPESPCARIGRVLSDDGLIGVYTFNWQQTDGHHKYCGFVVAKYNKKKPPAVTPLIDNTEKLGLTGILLPSQWYGCLYYRIITQKYRRTISVITSYSIHYTKLYELYQGNIGQQLVW